MHVVRLAFDGVGKHEMGSRDGFVGRWREEGSSQHLVNRCLLDSEDYVGGFEGLVDMRTSFDVV